jgi:enamine deaminase RidA (YjgF/YER057c/UK114 family)
MSSNVGLSKCLSENVEHRRFCGIHGEAEHFFVFTAPGNIRFKEQVEYIEANYEAKTRSLGLSDRTTVFRRIFLSDESNQIEGLRQSRLAGDPQGHPIAVSIIQQQPIPCAKIALLAYHIESNKPLDSQRLSPSHVLIRKNRLAHLWSTNLCAKNTDRSLSVGGQTESVFTDLINGLSMAGGDLYDNCIRTWIYVRDIDIFYQGMVDQRRALFAQYGLTGNTHFIASTGIEGTCADRHDLVMMDAYSILGLKPEQTSYLNDLNMLCPAKKYNVTFERGTCVAYADRSHYFISGTASVDNLGNTLYPGNILKQLERTLENIGSLLRAGHASLADLMYLIVYLRDPSDFEGVKGRLTEELPSVPMIFVQAAVCRPEWLIEIEGVAIKAQHQPSYPLF